MTNDEIVSNLVLIKDLNAQVDALRNARMADELVLVVQYKVDECNKKRNESAIAYQDQIDVLLMQIKVYQNQINQAI